jgi:hypothetical protein
VQVTRRVEEVHAKEMLFEIVRPTFSQQVNWNPAGVRSDD